MSQSSQPTKEQIRQYLEARRTQQCPPPSIPEIRRQLGWGMIPPSPAVDGAGTECPPLA